MRLRALLLCAAALAAGAAQAALPAPAASVRWLAPADGAVLVVGERVELAWEPVGPAAALAGADEWEVFLSVDRGRTWSVRLTPHLDLARRRFAVEVPDLPSPDVRLVLRAGDERVEREFDLPVRLRIVRPPGYRPGAALVPARAFRRGESAREGGSGVALWAAGGRRARSVRWYAFAGDAAALDHGGWAPPFPAFAAAPPEPSPALRAAPVRRARSPLEPRTVPIPSSGRARWSEPLEPLLASCRRNT